MDDAFSAPDGALTDTAQFQEPSDPIASSFDDAEQNLDNLDGEVWENNADGEIESLEPDSPAVEINGQVMSADELGRSLSFARQAASEVLQLRQETALLDQYARLSGMSRQQFLSALDSDLQNAYIRQEALRNGLEPDAFRQHLQIQHQQEIQKNIRLAPYRELLDRFPQLHDPANLPPEVAAQIQQGIHPVVAYQDYILSRQQASQQILSQQQALRDKCTGSASGLGNGEMDSALSAFLSVFDD